LGAYSKDGTTIPRLTRRIFTRRQHSIWQSL